MNPLFLLTTYDTKSGKEVVIGFRYDSNGKLKQEKGTLSEEDVMGSGTGKDSGVASAVYAISPDGCLPTDGGDIERVSQSCGGGTTSGGGVIEYAKIKEKKESWLDRGDVQYNRIVVRSDFIYGM